MKPGQKKVFLRQVNHHGSQHDDHYPESDSSESTIQLFPLKDATLPAFQGQTHLFRHLLVIIKIILNIAIITIVVIIKITLNIAVISHPKKHNHHNHPKHCHRCHQNYPKNHHLHPGQHQNHQNNCHHHHHHLPRQRKGKNSFAKIIVPRWYIVIIHLHIQTHCKYKHTANTNTLQIQIHCKCKQTANTNTLQMRI